MQLDLERCAVRSCCDTDAEELARHANNRQVWLQLRDRFPHPYTVEDAHEFIAGARSATPATAFAVTVGDVPVGAIGVRLRDDVERCSAVPFASNIASCRVLEKAGYVLEGRMRRSAIKAGVVQDQLSYAGLRGDEDR